MLGTFRRLIPFSVAFTILAGLAAPAAAPAAEPPIRLIVRGDDMGSSEASNEAAIRCFKDGVMRDVELMAVGPWLPEAARLLRENPGLDVGLHLTLTSEWDNVKWRPLTTAPSLVGRDGYFHPMIWPHPHYGKEGALKEQPWKLDEIERELRAQVELTEREVPHLSHLSDHMGFQALGPEVVALVKRLAGEYGLDIDPEALGVRWAGWDGKPETPSQKVESFVRVLEGLGPGTWVFVDHPALDTPEMRAVHHVGYEAVAVDRQGVTDAWTSPAAKDVIRRRGIELIGYKDLVIPRDFRRPGPEGSAGIADPSSHGQTELLGMTGGGTVKTHDSGHVTSRRTVLTRGALLGGALVPAALSARAEAQPPVSGRGPFDVRDSGATGDGKTLDTAALQGAIDACHRAGGGTVRVPPGTYLTKPIELRSFVTLHLEAGSTILGSPRLEDYTVEGRDASGESERAGVVTARGAERVAIVGRGTIDGNALAFHDPTKQHDSGDFDRSLTRQGAGFMPKGVLFEHGPIAHGERPGNLIRFFDCRDVLVHGVTIQNSPTWTSHYRKCENVTIEAVRINSDASGKRIPNDDGIDLVECDDVRILGCDIDTGDDCIALFGSQRVVVTNCTMTTRSVAIRVGYDHTRDIRDCVFSNLVIHDANRGLGVFVRGSGGVENVIFSDIVIRTRLLTGHWWGKAEPVHVSAVLFAPGVEKPGRIRNVTFARLRVEGEHGMILWGSPDGAIEDVTLDDVRVRIRRGPNSDTWGGNVDMRLTRDPKLAVFKRDLPALLALHTERLAVRNLTVEWADDVPSYFTHAIEAEAFRELVVDGFRGRQAQTTGAAIRLVKGEDAVVRDSRAAAGTDTFVEATEVTGLTVFTGNDTRAARQPVVPASFGGPPGRGGGRPDPDNS